MRSERSLWCNEAKLSIATSAQIRLLSETRRAKAFAVDQSEDRRNRGGAASHRNS